MSMKARIFVTLKKSVLDPQGSAVKHALESLNISDVEDVRIGKMIEVRLKDSKDRKHAEGEIKSMCDKLLSNPVIEDYRWEWAEN